MYELEMRSSKGETPQQMFNRIGTEFDRQMYRITEKATLGVFEKIPKYPPAKRGKMPIVSRKQLFFLRWAIRQGKIKVPYRRTAMLGRSITHRVERSSFGQFTGIIGTSVPYAPWVISDRRVPDGAGPQSKYHKETWFTLQGILKDNSDLVVRTYKEGLDSYLKSLK